MARHQSIDEQFSDSYSQKGLQPATGKRPVANIRNQKVSYKEQKAEKRLADDSLSPLESSKKPSARNIKNTKVQTGGETGGDASRTRRSAGSYSQPGVSVGKKKKLLPSRLRGARKLLARHKALIISTNVVAVCMGLWSVYLLPFAIINTILFGLTLALGSVTGESGNFLIDGIVAIGEFVLSTVAAASRELLGFDILEMFNPMTWYFVTLLIFLGFVYGQLLVIYLVYKLAFLEPLGGRGSGAKKGSLLMALIFYGIPVLNLFPWFLFWIFFIWKNPK